MCSKDLWLMSFEIWLVTFEMTYKYFRHHIFLPMSAIFYVRSVLQIRANITPKVHSSNNSNVTKKGKRKVQGVPQSQTAALPRPQEEEETDKSKQVITHVTQKSRHYSKLISRMSFIASQMSPIGFHTCRKSQNLFSRKNNNNMLKCYLLKIYPAS